MGAYEMIVLIAGIAGITSISIVKQITRNVGSKKLIKRIQELEAKNTELQERTENMEMLVGGIDTDLLESMMELQLLDGKHQNKEKIDRTVNEYFNTQKNTHKKAQNQNIEDSVRSIASKILKRVDGYLDEAEKEHRKKNNFL